MIRGRLAAPSADLPVRCAPRDRCGRTWLDIGDPAEDGALPGDDRGPAVGVWPGSGAAVRSPLADVLLESTLDLPRRSAGTGTEIIEWGILRRQKPGRIGNTTPILQRWPDPPPQSPCINVCVLDADGYCRGCYRTIDEIAGWRSFCAAEQRAVLGSCLSARRHGAAET